MDSWLQVLAKIPYIHNAIDRAVASSIEKVMTAPVHTSLTAHSSGSSGTSPGGLLNAIVAKGGRVDEVLVGAAELGFVEESLEWARSGNALPG